jgi:hypothetical protein
VAFQTVGDDESMVEPIVTPGDYAPPHSLRCVRRPDNWYVTDGTRGMVGDEAAALARFRDYQQQPRRRGRQRWQSRLLVCPISVDCDGCVYVPED